MLCPAPLPAQLWVLLKAIYWLSKSMSHNIVYYVYLFLLLSCWLVSIRQFSSLNIALKLFSVQLGLTFVAECLAFYMAIRYRNNMAVYHVFSVIQLILTLLYFNYSIEVFRVRHWGYLLIMPSMVICVLNILFYQPIHQLNSYFLVYEGLIIVSIALFAFLRMILQEQGADFSRNPYFRLNLLLIFFWSITFLSWGAYDYVNEVHPELVWSFNYALLAVNMITYSGIAITFYQLQPIKPEHG